MWMGVSHFPVCRREGCVSCWTRTTSSLSSHHTATKLHGDTGRSRLRPEKRRIEMKMFLNALLRSASGAGSRHVRQQRVATLGRRGLCSKVEDVFTFLHQHHVMFAGSIVSVHLKQERLTVSNACSVRVWGLFHFLIVIPQGGSRLRMNSFSFIPPL